MQNGLKWANKVSKKSSKFAAKNTRFAIEDKQQLYKIWKQRKRKY